MEPVQLSPEQQELCDKLRKHLSEIKQTQASRGEVDSSEIEKLGQEAHQLHVSLRQSGTTVRHHQYMVKNRGMDPDHPNFYKHIHPVEDLLAFIADQSANDDPVDQTLGHEFTFQVYCRRSGHDNIYRLTRTNTGWTVKWEHPPEVKVARDGRVGGRPGTGLFSLLDHDLINYPEDLPGYLEWLWTRAAEDGLPHDAVQEAL